MSRDLIRLQPTRGLDVAPVCMVRHAERELRLPPGRYVIGRGGACHIVLDGGQVSRRHAELVVTRDGATISDLGSSNGVFLDGERVTSAPRDIEDGNVVFVGSEQLLVRFGDVAKKAREWTPTLETLARTGRPTPEPIVAVLDPPTSPDHEKPPPEPNATDRMNVLEMLGSIADKAITLGRTADAERLLGGHLANVLADARAGKGVVPVNRELASRLALKLSVGSGEAKWFDYVIDLFTAERATCPDGVIIELQVALGRVGPVDLERMDAYVSLLRDLHLEGEDHRLAQRVEEVLEMARARSS